MRYSSFVIRLWQREGDERRLRMTTKQKLSLALVLLISGLLVVGLIGSLVNISEWQAPVAALTTSHNGNPGAEIAIAQQVSPNPMQSGSSATYTLHVTNSSTLALPAIVTDVLPSQLTPAGVTTWTPVISAGATWTQQLPVTVAADSHGLAVNEVQVLVPTSRAENLSYCTTCAEEDNINIPLRGDDVSHFQVIATHPTYGYTTDNCEADFSGCNLDVSSAPDDVTCTQLPDDGINVITVCSDSNWWLPHTMIVTVDSVSLAGHWLVWNKKIADEASWPEVLVFYQDGNMRIKPHPPLGRADVCYGSSVIVGPAPLDPVRPFVEVQTIVVDPVAMSMDVTYRNGGGAFLEVAVDRDRAEVDVMADYDTSESFATFRSMYVSDDNADAARVETAVGDFAMLDLSSPEWTIPWSALSGPRWFFYRQMASAHNTSAPDILIETIDGSVTHVARLAACVDHCSIYLPAVLGKD